MTPRVSVLMPTFNQARFLPRALESLLAQTLTDWEAIVVDDGSPDDTLTVLDPFLADPRLRLRRLSENQGLGAALNAGLQLSRAFYIAYLPSDDVWYPHHLASLVSLLDANPQAILAYSGVRHHYNRLSTGLIEGCCLQLVQVLHRKTPDRWLERSELVTDDLDRMLWQRLRDRGSEIGSSEVTCEWVDHPEQRHKLVREPEGGLNRYRAYYQPRHPLRFRSTIGNFTDEVEHYRRFRDRPDTPLAPDGLRILLVGELAYNPERVLAMEERGHRLFGLWMRYPYWFNTVGPLPFGHVTDLPREGWREAVREIHPDVIYALLNWQAVPFVHEVLKANPGVPFVWHFKEGPFISLEKGHWPLLVDLYTRSDGQIYSSPEMRDWFMTAVPSLRDGPLLILDGDLPKAEWFDAEPSPRLSERDGEIHTVVPGRPIGLHDYVIEALAAEGVHVHVYGDYTRGQWHNWIKRTLALAPRHLHLHPNVDQEQWVAEFSQYDAGWLHVFESENGGEIRRANWDDLNYPARTSMFAMTGLPMLQRDNAGSIVATQTLSRELGIGLFFRDLTDVGDLLRDEPRMAEIRANVWRYRRHFAFDTHADRLIAFFRSVIERASADKVSSPRAAPQTEC